MPYYLVANLGTGFTKFAKNQSNKLDKAIDLLEEPTVLKADDPEGAIIKLIDEYWGVDCSDYDDYYFGVVEVPIYGINVMQLSHKPEFELVSKLVEQPIPGTDNTKMTKVI